MKTIPLSFVLLAGAASHAYSAEPASLEAQISAIQGEKAARTPTQRKVDSQLLYLSREKAGQLAVEGAPALKSRAKSGNDQRVTVDISAAPGPELTTAITAAGGTVVYESPRWKSVRAILPASAFEIIAARADVKRIAPGAVAETHVVTNQADPAHKANTARTFYGTTGAGMKIGVISDSADHYLDSIAAGELPASFTILPGRSGIPASGEGTAMSEIVHDIAPGAEIFFAEAGPGKAGFADSITLLKAAGCKIIVDDISYSTAEWQFQDDEIGQAVNEVVDGGALYFSASGNEGNLKSGTSTTWEGDFADGGAAAAPLPVGRLHSFGTANYNTLAEADSFVVLQWSDEYHTSGNDYDLFILNAAGTTVIASSTNTQDGDDEPIETTEAHEGERIVVWKDGAAAARYLRVIAPHTKLQFQTAGQTIGHAATAKCICVASSDSSQAVATSPFVFNAASTNETSSSDGPHKMFYRPDGTPITPGNFLASGGVTLQTPAITAGDGGATSVPGFSAFYGTSAAAPASAALTALVWSRNPTKTNVQIRALIESSCIDIEAPGFDVNSGNGILMADLALTKTRTPQEVWRQGFFGVVLAAGDSLPAADPDRDGNTNVVEYATGSNPVTAGGSPFGAVALSGGTFSLNYHRDPAATDATISFEHSTSLSGWLPATPSGDALQSTSGGVQLRTALFAKDPDGIDFFRLKVTTP